MADEKDQQQNPYESRIVPAQGAAAPAPAAAPPSNKYESRIVAPQPGQPGAAPEPPGFWNTLGREVKSTGETLKNFVPGIYHAAADAPTKEEQAQGFGNTGEKLGMPKGTQWAGNALGRAALPFQRMVVNPLDVASKWYGDAAYGLIPDAYEQALSVAPEAMGTGAGNVIAGQMIKSGGQLLRGEGVGPALTRIQPVPRISAVPPAVPGVEGGEVNWDVRNPIQRMAAGTANRVGLAAERATTPAVAGPAIGGAIGHHVAGGTGAAVGAGIGEVVAQGFEKPFEPKIGLPGLRTAFQGDEGNLITPKDAQGYIESGQLPPADIKVAVPGKSISFGEWLKSQPTPRVEEFNRATAPIPAAEANAAASQFMKEQGVTDVPKVEQVQGPGLPQQAPSGTMEGTNAAAQQAINDIMRERGISDYNEKYARDPNTGQTIKAARGTWNPPDIKDVQVVEPPKSDIASPEEVNKLAEGEVKKLSKPVEEAQRLMRNRVPKDLVDKLTVDHPDVGAKLIKGTNENFAEMANELGLEGAGEGGWKASDFGRSGKEMSPKKALVMRHLMENYSPDEVLNMTDHWGPSQAPKPAGRSK